MGLVALGIGQVQAQKPETDTQESWSLRLPDNDTQSWSMRLFEPLATMITTAKIRAVGRQRLYQCEDGAVPPNCRYNDPPAGINQCGAWNSTFRVVWGVQCPPTFPTQFIYWMDRCAGGYSEVARWTLHPSGTCANGYYDANSTLEGTNPDCLRRGPDILNCNPCGNNCGFNAFDGSGRRFLNKTTVVTFNFDSQGCPIAHGAQHTEFSYTEYASINSTNCTQLVTGSGTGSSHEDDCDGRTCDCTFNISYVPRSGWTYTSSCSDCNPTCGGCQSAQVNFGFWWSIECNGYWHCGTPSCSATRCVQTDYWTGTGTASKTTVTTLSNECPR